MEATSRDLLSDLPDDILHHIFSLLGDNDIVRLRVLSRRFQNLCIAAPSFSFSQSQYSLNCPCTYVINFMNTVRQHRPHALKINQLAFSSLCGVPKHRALHRQWIKKLFKAFQVDELSLDYDLPWIFRILPRFSTLKVLKLNMTVSIPVKLPEMKLTSVETLYLETIVTDDSVGKWVSQCFPFLKHLFLIQINMLRGDSTKQDLSIQSSCLEELTIHGCCNFKLLNIVTENLRVLSCFICDINCRHDEYEFEVEISAPNLQCFSWKGTPKRLRYDEGTFKNLHVATIKELKMPSSSLNLLIQLIAAIRFARILHLDMDMLQNLYKLNTMAISFENLCHIEIKVELKYDMGYKYVGTFLERLSNLEAVSLTLLSPPPIAYGRENKPYFNEASFKYSFRTALTECRRAEMKTIKGLKKVKLIIRRLHPMAILIGMMMKWCVDLEEMTLTYLSCYHKSIIQEGPRYLHSFETASNSDLLIRLFPQSLSY